MVSIVNPASDADAALRQGIALANLGKWEEALGEFDRVIAIKPGSANAHVNRGVALQNLQRFEEALASYDRALALDDASAETHNNRGAVLHRLDRLEEAVAAYQRAIALKPDFAEAHSNLGVTLQDLSRSAEALASFDRAIALKPDYAWAQWNKALLELRQGNFKEGWRLYEWRWREFSKAYVRDFRQPLWLGDRPISGQTLLIHAEQGWGDTIQCCRYVPLVEALGARVVLEVPAALTALMASLKSRCTVVEQGQPLPAFDLHCPIMSLPLAFGTTVETIPADIPYLRADPEWRQLWRQRLGIKLRPRVGLVWSGARNHPNDHHRSIPLALLEPLLAAPVELHAIQKDIRPEDARVLATLPGIRTHQALLGDLGDTAALIEELDLVISVDTSVAHLAGALGRPVWILLPFMPDFRWMLERADSPWYPTATLFRQPARGDWSSVVARVGQRLESAWQGGIASMATGIAHRSEGRIDAAIACFRAAVAQDPDAAEAHYQLGYTLSFKGELDEAAAHARRAIEIEPGHAEAHNNLGYIAFRREKYEEAAQHYQHAIELKSDYVKAQYNLALALSLLGRHDEAIAGYRRTISLDPKFGEAYHNLCLVLIQQNRAQEAVFCYRQLLTVYPDNVAALQNLGNALLILDQKENAERCYRRALAIQPDNATLHRNLGDLLAGAHRYEEAISSYRQALAIKTDLPEAEFGLGACLSGQGKMIEAEAAYRRALVLRPNYAEAHYDLGNALSAQGRNEEAQTAFAAALRSRPDYAEAHCNMGFVLGRFGLISEAIACSREAIRLKPDLAQAHSNLAMMMNYDPSYTPDEILAEHRRFAAQFEDPLKKSKKRGQIYFLATDDPSGEGQQKINQSPLRKINLSPLRRSPLRTLRIGYVSPDFRVHSVSFFMEPILAHHDKSRFEIWCYHSSHINDHVTARIRALADHWLPCADLTDAELAERIMADGIDILVDLSGHTGVNRLLTFARKPAPVQVTYLGYPTTTGLSAMDYRLTTWDIDPEGSDRWYTERLYRLPRTLWCYRQASGATPSVVAPPAMRNGFVTFGSMNNIFKVSTASIALWARLLKSIPGSRLLMTLIHEGRARDVIHERFAAHGIGQERLILHSHLPAERFRTLPSFIDIALDPFPYNGTTTTCETLWMGIPVITLIGRTSVSRSGYALLKSAGLTELCAKDEAEYLEIAARLAQDLAGLDRLRRTVRERFDASPMRDEAALTRDIENAYRDMWQRWCGSGEP